MNEEENNHEFPPGEGGGEHAGGNEQLSSARPAVAAAPGKVLLIAGMAVILAFFIIKSLFFTPKQQQIIKPPGPGTVAPPGKNNEPPMITPPNMVPDVPPMNPVPPPSEQKAPPAPPPPPPLPPSITPGTSGQDQQLKSRIHSPMMAGGAHAAPASAEDKKKAAAAAQDPNAAWADNVAQTEATTVEATQVKHLDRTLVQGKIVEGVLETAIDSELPGDVRAIVSHDTYAENGRNILIPKGSRIVGKYNSSVKKGQGRVFIIWTRVIRPDGVDVAINSPGVDSLGRAGLEGFVDDHFFEAFTTAILTSSIDVATAAVGDALFGNQQQTQTTGTGGYTTTSSPTATAMQTAVSNIGSVGQAIVGSAINIAPTIHVDQGQMISIFVDKDVVFPMSGSVFVQ